MCKNWKKIIVNRVNLQLNPTLCGGQSFRWRRTGTNSWVGVFRNLIWIITQDDNFISYKCIGGKNDDVNVGKKHSNKTSGANCSELLSSYLRLNVDLEHYYKIWAESDVHFRETAPKMFGIRILNQEITENIFSFICSSNNNIKRISSMVEKLCEFYGEFIAEVDGQKYYSFPKVEDLTQDTVESDLRKAGFGYRAKFIYESACAIKNFGGDEWLNKLKVLSYKDAKKQLMELPGVGAKVADCICLMSLGHMESVPVDTHIFKVASDIYLPHLKKYKNMTDKIYNEIGDHFRSLHGEYAGWANTILFCSDLKQHKATNNKKENKKVLQTNLNKF